MGLEGGREKGRWLVSPWNLLACFSVEWNLAFEKPAS